MRKKLLSAVLATTMIASLLAGCGSNGGNDSTNGGASSDSASSEAAGEITGEITVLTQRTDLVSTDLADYKAAFEEKYPGTTVSYEAMEDYEGDVSTRLSTGDYGDVFMIPNTIPQDELADFCEPLGTVEELSDTYTEAYLYAKQSGGVVYGLASGANVSAGIVYNKKVFEDAGVTEIPKTTDEFLAALQAIKDKGECTNPYYTNTHDAWALSQWEGCTHGMDGDASYIVDKMANDPTPFDKGKPHYVVYKLLYDIIDQKLCEADPFTTEWESSKTALATGEIGSMVMGSWAVSQLQEAAKNAGEDPANIGYMPFPVTGSDGNQYVSASGDYAYAINVNSSNKATARAFIDYMLQESGYADKQGEISIVKGSAMPATLADFEGANMVIDNPASPENEGKWDAVHNESELGLWSGSEYQIEIVEAAFGNVDKDFDTIMGEWNEKWSAALESVNATWDK